MEPLLLQTLKEENKSLELQLSDLRQRFDIVVNWIKSQYNYDLIGLPEPIANAVCGNSGSSTVVEMANIVIKREEVSLDEQDSILENSSSNSLDNWTPSIGDETEGELNNKDKATSIKLEKLEVEDVEKKDSITKSHSSKPALKTNKRVKKTGKNLELNRDKKLIIEASEYVLMISSLPPDRSHCVVCHKIFSIPKQLERHEVKVHLTKDEQSKYNIYRKTIPKIPKVKKNANIEKAKVKKPVEKGKYRHKCETCGIVVSNLTQHRLTHSRNYVCSQCGKTFTRPDTLRVHQMAIHEKVKNHKCRFCEKTFLLIYAKNDHEKKHFGDPEVTCKFCNFIFTCSKNMKRHVKNVHENQRLFKCNLCDKSFKTSHSRKNHLDSHENPNGLRIEYSVY